MAIEDVLVRKYNSSLTFFDVGCSERRNHLSMSTTQVTATLFQLQQLDLELDRLTAELQSVQHALQGDNKLQRLRADCKAAQQQLQTALQAQKEAEWALEDANRHLKAQEQRLYDGNVRNAKELQSLQQEVQRLQAQQNRQEELVLEVIDTAESLQEIAKAKALALVQAEQKWQEECSSLKARRDQLESKQAELQTKRARKIADIKPELFERYDAMRRTKQGRAISKVEHNSCQWCRVILTPSELQRIRISAELQTCTNCGRILYYDR
jgi:predicted  nucleic acid-binding Zn-ribbon protein